jgi:uncharacterized protein (TIGR04222 family)
VNPLDLPGPQFLLFYTFFAAAVVAGLVFWRRRAELSKSPAKIDLSDPYLIAYLRGGEREVLRVATVTLIDRGLLVRTGSIIRRAENASPDSVRRPIEQALLMKYARGGEVSWMFEDDGLSKACEPYGATLRRARLLPDEYVNQARLVRLVIASFVLSVVGFTKVLIALDAGRSNVGFLIVLMIASVVVAAAVSFPRLTESGKAMIKDVQSLYTGLLDRSALMKPGGAGIDTMMLGAVFGLGALAGPGFSLASGLFPDQKKRMSGSCAAGDGGCGSSSTCSSGSSCGSSCGGGCGGGCGGCGG